MTAVSGPSKLEQRLRRTAPADWFGREPAAFAVDGIEPGTVVAPDSPEAVAAVLADAAKAGAAVIPWGGGSHMGIGSPPEGYDLALDLTRLDAVIAYEPADLTATVQAGIRLDALQKRLAEQGQWLPLDPPAAPAATIGGVLAANASGPGRIAYGSARDLVIGMTVATTDGYLVKTGGRVVKNVAGYDLAKMHIGALGSLGVITQVSLKIAPLPKSARTISVSSENRGALLRIAFAVRNAGLPATGIAIAVPLGAGEARLLLRFAGSSAAVDRSRLDAERLAAAEHTAAEQAPEAVWQETGAMRQFGGVLVRLSHSPKAAASTLEQAATLGAGLLSYPTAGITYAHLLALSPNSTAAILTLRTSVEAGGSALVLEGAPPEAKTQIGVWGSTRGEIGLMRALKLQIDPNRILSPGRFVGGI